MKPRLNHQITSAEVRVTQGPQTGVFAHHEAMQIAGEHGMDLIEISPQAKPPVCVIQELGKWKYEQDKRLKASRRPVSETKQVQIRPVTDTGDLETKARQAREFLEEGHKVRVVVRLRGRELSHETEAQQALTRFIDMLDGKVEQRSGLEGRQIVAMVVHK